MVSVVTFVAMVIMGTRITTVHVITMVTFSTVVTFLCEFAIVSWLLCSSERTRTVAMCRQFLSCSFPYLDSSGNLQWLLQCLSRLTDYSCSLSYLSIIVATSAVTTETWSAVGR